MNLPRIASREEWLDARTSLLAKEKAMTRARDALNVERRELPMVEVEKDYRFEGPEGEVSLVQIFEGRPQLIVGHFMFDPSWEDGCPSCSAGADEVSNGLIEHLHNRGTTLAYISRAPLEKLERYKAKKGWTFPWYSSHGSDFNYDFDVTDRQLARTSGLQLPQSGGARAEGHRLLLRRRRAERAARHELLPPRRGARVPHLLDLRPRCRDAGRLVLLARPDGAGPPGGVGGAEGPRKQGARADTRHGGVGLGTHRRACASGRPRSPPPRPRGR